MNHINGLTEVPYFERQESDDFVALQDSRRIIDVLHHRVRSLENINIDLEYRLEQQAKQTMQAEHEYTEVDRAWQVKYAEMQKEANEWKKRHDELTQKKLKLHEQLYRTERELYGILQRKHELMRGGQPHGGLNESQKSGPSHLGSSEASSGGPSTNSSARPTPPPPKPPPRGNATNTPLSSAAGPVEELCDVYKKLSPELRERRFIMDMGDFLGF